MKSWGLTIFSVLPSIKNEDDVFELVFSIVVEYLMGYSLKSSWNLGRGIGYEKVRLNSKGS